jgi:PKD repeat protein
MKKYLTTLLTVVAAVLLVDTAARASNVNGSGASLNLLTADFWSATAQSNGTGARLVSAGTPSVGVVPVNSNGGKLIIEPLNAIAGNGSTTTAAFMAAPLSGNAPLSVQFTDMSSGGLYTVATWDWDFGDNTPMSTEQNPTHVYQQPGNYSVSLTITTSGGPPAMILKSNYISATSPSVPAASHCGLFLLAAVLVALGVWRTFRSHPRKTSPIGRLA